MPSDRVRRWLLALVTANGGCRCGQDESEVELPDVEPQVVEASAPVAVPAVPRRVVVHQARDLEGVDLSQARELDLALSDIDRLGRLDDVDASAVCTGLDLAAIAARAPQLRALRVSGCPDALVGLPAFARTLEELTLADVPFDAAQIERIAALERLGTLVLARVTAPDELDPAALRKLPMRRVELHELDRDSAVADMLDLWPTTLAEVALVGSWAGHDAMQTLSGAAALQRLDLRDTRVGNFSLNQIKPLAKLRELHWAGDTFNDNSPLYFRDLAVDRFVCDCPRFGDGGLRTLRHCESVRHVELSHSRVTDAGLAALVQLPRLESLVLHDRDVGEAGFVALATVPTLKRLELSGETADPKLPHLGDLRGLEVLRLGYPSVDDRAAPQLAPLVALTVLDLGGTKISDVGLAALERMTAMRELVLSRTRITNRGLAHLVRMTKLQRLDLDHTDLVDAGLVHLAGLAALQRLRIDHTLVTDAGLAHLVPLKALRSIDVSGTVVTEAGLAELAAALPELRDIVHEP